MLVWNDNTMFAVIINVGVLSLLLYVAFGPVDGNPIGLGLLAVAVVPIAGMGILIGVVKLLVRYLETGLTMFKMLGVLVILYALYAAFTGSVYAKSGISSRTVRRDESPEYFWIVIVIYFGLGVALLSVF